MAIDKATNSKHKVPDNNRASQQDYKVALVLLLISGFLLIHTFGFPMSGSYGGVENQWFVSPALFPLIVIGLLILCSVLLLLKSLKNNGYRQFTVAKGWIGDWQESRVQNRWYVIGTLLFYVYIYIPSVDFYIASVLFLASLTQHFYHQSMHSFWRIICIHVVLSATLILIKFSFSLYDDTHWLTVNQDQPVIMYSDIAGATAIFLLLAMNLFLPIQQNLKKACIQSSVIVFVPLVLIVIFTFVLYVPMPVEYGSVSTFLYYLVYDVLAAT